MEIAILGGTGDIGQGLALRWAHDTDHRIRIGSRMPEKASESAAEYRDRLAARGIDPAIDGHENAVAAEGAEMVVLAAPPEYVADLAEEIGGVVADHAIVVSPAVKLSRDNGAFRYDAPDAGSHTARVGAVLPPGIPIVGAFHSLAAGRLADLDADLGMDTLVIGDDADAKATVIEVASQIDGLRALDAGPLSNAPAVEAMTPLCINVALNNRDMRDLGIRFV